MQDGFYYVVEYACFFFLQFLAKKQRSLRLFDGKGVVHSYNMLIILHLGGILLFGIIPLIFHESLSYLQHKNVSDRLPVWLTLSLALVLIFLSPGLAKRRFSKLQVNWNLWLRTAHILIYFLVRIVFIAVYEGWFRGYLLADSITAFGLVAAIAGNVFCYALLHCFHGWQDVIACIPFGILLCCLCVWVGATWPAIIIHLSLTIPYEIGFIQQIRKNQTVRN